MVVGRGVFMGLVMVDERGWIDDSPRVLRLIDG
jgi:hypothetical protein